MSQPTRRATEFAHAIALAACAAAAATVTSCHETPPPAASPESAPRGPIVTLSSLLTEMADVTALARLPAPPYRALRATSYNRASVARDQPGWFADSDGIGFIREEEIPGRPATSNNGRQTEAVAGRHEYVVMEQAGPGCLTKLWTPYFYYDLSNHVGPRVRIYLDGAAEPIINAPLIELVTGNEWPASYGPPPQRTMTPLPFAKFTARAGNFYLPVPFANGCKVTLDDKPFYYSIDSRAYPEGTTVETFTWRQLRDCIRQIDATELALGPPRPSISLGSSDPSRQDAARDPVTIAAHGLIRQHLTGGGEIRELAFHLDPAEIAARPQLLRQLVLHIDFDGEADVWCPLGDFFASPNELHELHTRARDCSKSGELVCRFTMPFQKTSDVELQNLSDAPAHAAVTFRVGPVEWSERSLHFHASWRPDDVVAGDHFEDWNFVDVEGEGLFVGDQWTVLNETDGWWGEGDEKIYVDASVERGFPDHFGTGTEDYYGWAGGVNPTRADVFSQPLLANVCVGSTERDSTRGFNVLTRERALDAIPFTSRFVFDMEASPGVDQRGANDRLGYSSVCFWYARPGARANRGAEPAGAMRPLMSFK